MNTSSECSKSELDLFSVPPTQTSIEEGKWDNVNPESGYKDNTSILFKIPSTDSHYMDLSETQLYLSVKLLAETSPIGEKKVGPVNNLLHSMFYQIKIKFNEKDVENSNGNYHYKAYFENLLSFNSEAKKTFLRNEGWVDDTPGAFDEHASVQTGSGTSTSPFIPSKLNNGYIKRREMFLQGKTVELCGRIHSDVFNINKYILNNVNVSLELFKNKPILYLIGDKDEAEPYKIIIESAHLKFRRVKISPSVMLAHAMVLEKTTAKYPLKRTIVHNYPYEFASTKFEKCLHSGVMPSRVLIALVETDRVSGSLNTNPFKFDHCKVQSIMLKAASSSLPYSSELEFDYSKGKYMEAYNTLFTNIKGTECGITYTDFAGGNTVYAFDLTPDLCNMGHYNVMKNGSLNLSLKVEEALPKSITIMTYMEFDNMIEIDSKRNIFIDYNL